MINGSINMIIFVLKWYFWKEQTICWYFKELITLVFLKINVEFKNLAEANEKK